MKPEQLIPPLQEQLLQVKPTLVGNLTPTDNFRDNRDLDSLELVEFVARLEQQFGLFIPDADLIELESLKATAEYLSRRLNDA